MTIKRKLTEPEIQERNQKRREKYYGIKRGEKYDFPIQIFESGHGTARIDSHVLGTVLSLFPNGILLRFENINRFLTWWEFDKIMAGQMYLTL